MAKANVNPARSLAVLLWCSLITLLSPCWAAETQTYSPEVQHEALDISKIPRPPEKPESILEFFRERTHFGYGLNEWIFDNFFFQDNNKQEEELSILEGKVLFADPRGSLLYGVAYDGNAARYHRLSKGKMDHDVKTFFHFDPGGRFQLGGAYGLSVNNSLVVGPDSVDILRRSKDFQRFAEHKWNVDWRYDLDSIHSLDSKTSYSILDDQTVNDADTDRKKLTTSLDLNHILKPGWTLSGGYEFRHVFIPGNKLKSSNTHALRLGTHYILTDLVDLDTIFTLGSTESKDGTKDTEPGLTGTWEYKAGPRTTLKLTYGDQRRVSYAVSRRRFRDRNTSVDVFYLLTPLVELTAGAHYEKQISEGGDVLQGTTASTATSRSYNLKFGIHWKVRENAKFLVDYTYSRSKSADYTGNLWVFTYEVAY